MRANWLDRSATSTSSSSRPTRTWCRAGTLRYNPSSRVSSAMTGRSRRQNMRWNGWVWNTKQVPSLESHWRSWRRFRRS
ncbi:hypothetical protein EMPG_13698 [Blastomyces silverae]|uniref:Uncharacterized protein n=1 Tax=Blastomyces silverae TaxID=2060906 RepID=A0A0H1BHM2_9EURO|nr:hypothetical protein EMPG_13698 [Blastomyces silverae]